MELEYKLKQFNIPLVACHNDPVPNNFVENYKARLYLIDWEYSGMNDPMWDLASFSIKSDFTKEEDENLIKLYFDGAYDGAYKEDYKTRIDIYKICQDLLWTLWAKYKVSQGEDYGEYALERWERGKKALKKISNP